VAEVSGVVAEEMLDLKRLDDIVAKRGKLPDATIPILQDAQAAYGYLPEEVLRRVSEITDITARQLYGVATFYTQFRLEPVGENIIKVCHGTACHVGGAERISEVIHDELGVEEGGTTADRKFTLENVACLGCCSLSPVVMINETVYGRLTGSKIRKVLRSYRDADGTQEK